MASLNICLITAICCAVPFRMGSADVVSRFDRLDINTDEFLSLTEVRRGVVLDFVEDLLMLRRLFNAVDRDHDGLLNRGEACGLFRKIRELASQDAEECRVQARGLRCLTWQMHEIQRLRSSGVLETESV
mmetsp:Transcript_52811/g.140988  ORF Transcript_52811/g.140988 Transcript_52811/m.140988 type:complete len:130 (-) Transcript_52811:447-836(-)